MRVCVRTYVCFCVCRLAAKGGVRVCSAAVRVRVCTLRSRWDGVRRVGNRLRLERRSRAQITRVARCARSFVWEDTDREDGPPANKSKLLVRSENRALLVYEFSTEDGNSDTTALYSCKEDMLKKLLEIKNICEYIQSVFHIFKVLVIFGAQFLGGFFPSSY